MGGKELIEALLREGEKNIRAIRMEAEDESGKIRADTVSKISRIRDDLEKTNSAAIKRQTEAILGAADRKARAILLSSEKALSDRLYEAAVKILPLLRETGYSEIFHALANELPPYQWQVVRVNPDDQERAKECFPGSTIVPDKHITAGMDVADKGEGIRVVNTFERRLENSWAELLPELINEVYRRLPDYGISESD